jgi:acetoin utilization deacetylase AcuC-like enzyme
MKVFFDNNCLLHDPPYEYLSGKQVPYFEVPERITRIKQILEQHPAIFQFANADPDIDLEKHILRVHTPEYLNYLEHAYDEWTIDGGDKVTISYIDLIIY